MNSGKTDLHSQIETHPGKQILDALNAYRISKNIFAGNAFEFRQLIRPLEDINDPLKIDGVEQRGRLDDLFSEVVRHLHNFLASGNTLIDHTRNLMGEEFISETHRSEYQIHIERTFANDPLARFIKEFRNFVLHRATPHIGLTHWIEPAKKELNLQLTPLLSWQKWSPPARSFLETHRPDLRILALVDDYENMVKASHESFVMSFQTHYEPQICGALALINAWNRQFLK